MKRVNISELKAHLSTYLDEVRRGETVEVCDRRTPIARLSPLPTGIATIRITPAKKPASEIGKIKGAVVPDDVDIVAILRESRDQR